MSINKNPQSAYETLHNLLTDDNKRLVFGQGGLFGYRKEDHQVLELFAEYSCNEIYKNGGVAPQAMNSESFIQYLNSQEKLSDSKKQEIIKRIRDLRDQSGPKQIIDYPIEKNTLRNFAELLYALDIGRQPEKITVRYELALEKALGLKPFIEGTKIENEKEKTEKSETLEAATSEQKSDAIDSTASSETDATAASETGAEVEASAEEKSEKEANARIDIKSKTETSTLDESEKAEKSKEPAQETKMAEPKPKSEAEPKEDSELGEPLTEKNVTEKPDDETTITPEKSEESGTSQEKLKEKPLPRTQKHLIIKVQTPVYQRLNLPKKSSRRISPIESRLGNLRKAEKAENKGNQSRVQHQQQTGTNPQGEQSQIQTTQNPYKNIPMIPVRQKSKKKSLAQGMSTATKWIAGAGVASPLIAGGSSANAETITSVFSHFEKILKFLF